MYFFSLRNPGSFLLVAGALIVSSFTNSVLHQPKSKSLFNGKDLRGWDTYVGPSYDTIQKKFVGKPVGLNNDPDRVFTVVKVETTLLLPLLRITSASENNVFIRS